MCKSHRLDYAKAIPWVECNTEQKSVVDRIVAGLLIWQEVADTAIVSTSPGHAALYATLRQRVPGMRIIPGLKTRKHLESQFDSASGWKLVLKEVRQIMDISGDTSMVLENETAMKAYINGKQTVDLTALRKCLKFLPRDLEYLWYPSIFGNPDQQIKNKVVCQVVEWALSDVRFLDQRYQSEQAVKSASRIAADKQLQAIVSKPTLLMAYFYGPAHHRRWWDDEQLPAVLELAGRELVVYPGQKRWPEASRILVDILKAVKKLEQSELEQIHSAVSEIENDISVVRQRLAKLVGLTP
jgi:hypothetical protein